MGQAILVQIWTLISIAFLAVSGASAVEKAEEFPSLEIPGNLRPYTDEEQVIQSLREIFDLLATAKFVTEGEPYLTGDCDTAQFHSVFRGYQLAKTSYFLFVSKIERGWHDPDPPDHSFEGIALFQPNRLLLATSLTPQLFIKFAEVSSLLQRLPDNIKADLLSFFVELKRYRAYHEFSKRRPKDFEYVKSRIEETCVNEKYDYTKALEEKTQAKIASTKFDLERCEARRLTTTEAVSAAYRDFINGVRDADAPALSACLDGSSDYYPTLLLGKEGAIRKQSMLHPTHYMLSFWLRREQEGSTRIAEFLLDRAILALR